RPGRPRARRRPGARPDGQRPRDDRQRFARLVPPQLGRAQLHPAGPSAVDPFVESFGSRVRDEVPAVEAFDSVIEAHTVMNNWKDTSNHQPPHSSHGWRTAAALAGTGTRRRPAPPTPTRIAAAGPTKGAPSPGSLLY